MGSFLKLKSLLNDKDDFVLVSHISPDGDAIGSLLAFGKILEQKGKKVTLVSREGVPEVFKFLQTNEVISELPKDFEVAILLDNGDLRRTGFPDELFQCKKDGKIILNIDHHPKNDIWKFANINYGNEKASSTAEILYELFVGLDYEIMPEVATGLLTGIFTDTGGFKHSNTTNKVLEIVSDLLKKGAKLKKIAKNVESSKPLSLFKLWGVALERLVINQKYGIAFSYLTQGDLKGADSNEDEISGLVNLLNSVPEAKIAMLLYETKDDKIKGSLRTESDNVDVSKLASILGGGGHKKAAGFTLLGKLSQENSHLKIF